MKTTQAWGWLAAGVLALGLNGIYQDGGSVWVHRALNGRIGGVAARSEAVLALATGRVDWFAAKVSAAPRVEPASCRIAAAFARLQSKIQRAQIRSRDSEEITAAQEVAMARMEVQRDLMEARRDRMEAQVEPVRLSPVAFNAMKISVPVCARVRVNIPSVNIPQVPMVRISAPVDVEMGSDPI